MKFARERGGNERGENAATGAKQTAGAASSFGRRQERPDADLMRVLNTGSSGASQRTPRSISPPLD